MLKFQIFDALVELYDSSAESNFFVLLKRLHVGKEKMNMS